jgi:hypothetical protein
MSPGIFRKEHFSFCVFFILFAYLEDMKSSMENALKVSQLFGKYAESILAYRENMTNLGLLSVPKFVSNMEKVSHFTPRDQKLRISPLIMAQQKSFLVPLSLF